MTTDTPRTLSIAGSPAGLLKLTGMGIVMTGVSAAIAIPLIADLGDGLFVTAVGWFGTAFFALCTVVAIVRLCRARETVLTISPQGIRDTRIAGDVIPWSAVTNISTWEAVGQKAMVLAVDATTEARLHLTVMARSTRTANRVLGADGLCITASGLKIDYPTLLQTSRDYWAVAQDIALPRGR